MNLAQDVSCVATDTAHVSAGAFPAFVGIDKRSAGSVLIGQRQHCVRPFLCLGSRHSAVSGGYDYINIVVSVLLTSVSVKEIF